MDNPEYKLLNMENSYRYLRSSGHQSNNTKFLNFNQLEPWNQSMEFAPDDSPQKYLIRQRLVQTRTPQAAPKRQISIDIKTETQPQQRPVYTTPMIQINRPITSVHTNSVFTEIPVRHTLTTYHKLIDKLYQGSKSPRKNSTNKYKQSSIQVIMNQKKKSQNNSPAKIIDKKLQTSFTWTEYQVQQPNSLKTRKYRFKILTKN